MENYLEQIKNKLKKKFNPKSINLIDKSYLHKSHKSYDSKKFHLKLILECERLKKMDVIHANRLIFSELREDMYKKIHALEIEIK